MSDFDRKECDIFSSNIIYVDTREQKPFRLETYGIPTEIKTLKFGDYTIKGAENQFAIERKASEYEFAVNLGLRYDRFCREMEKMSKCEVKYILCEFPRYMLMDYPEHTKLTKKQKEKATPGHVLMDRLNRIETKYKIECLFHEDKLACEERFIELVYAFFR